MPTLNLLINLLQKLLPHHVLELFFIEILGGDPFVLFHPIYEEPVKSFQEYIAEVLHEVRHGSLAEGGKGDGVLFDGVEKEMVPWSKVRAEPFVEDIYELEELYLLPMFYLVCYPLLRISELR